MHGINVSNAAFLEYLQCHEYGGIRSLKWGSTEVRSSVSNTSTVELDSYGRCLQRVLDQKVHKLRSITDDSITTELDRIVCRLMKLALYATKGQHSPPPMSWLQHKLFDLLSLTERAIERRRRHYFENFALKAIEYCKEDSFDDLIENQQEIIDDAPMDDIMTKYQHVISPLDQTELQDFQDTQTLDVEFNNGSVTSVEVNDQELDTINNDNGPQEKQNTIDFVYQTDEVPSMENFYNNQSENPLHDNKFKIIANYNILPESDSPVNMISKVNIDSIDEIDAVKEENSTVARESILQDKKININENCNFSIKINKSKHNKRVKSKTSLKNIAKLKKVVSVEDGNKRVITKNYKKKQSKLSKPIPDSLVNLCNMEENEDLKENNLNVLNKTNVTNDISNNEDCILLSIVTESDEETIALRRNIGTDPDTDYDINNDTISETVINITKQESFENVQSQTIFILDINEPTTSKGIRNISTDVQCGPDLSSNCALSPVTSLMKTPKLFNNGIKIDDSFDNIFSHKKTCDFGMCTEYSEKYLDVSRGIGIKIKDSDVNFRDKIEFPMEKAPENLSCEQDLTVETKVLRHILPKIDDSVSEFCDSVGSLQKSLLACSSLNTSISQVQSQNDNTLSKLRKTKTFTRELVHGGVHVHSFKDKMVSEDVIYQGEWKRGPKSNVKKQPNEIAKTKKKTNSKHKMFHTKDKITTSTTVNKNNRFPQRTMLPKNKENKNVQKVLNTANQKMKSVQKISTTVRVDKNVTRVVSKITVRTRKTKSIKSFTTKKTTKMTNIIAKNDVEVYKEKLQNYLPRYLRRKVKNMNMEINNTKINTEKDCDLKNINLNIESQEIAKNLLKIQDNVQHHIDYLVFQNGVEVEPSVDKQLILPSEQANAVIKYECSPQSHNSSTCSSPNSVATVRPLAQNKIVISNKNSKVEESDSSVKSEFTSSKYKHQTYHKLNKKGQMDLTPKAHSNKENIPQSSKNILSKTNKTTKTSKSIFKGKTKNVLMHNNEHVSIKSSSTKFSKRPTKKSFTSSNTTKNNSEKESNVNNCSKSKDILIMENLNSENENISTSTSDANDSVDEVTSPDKLSLNNEISNENSSLNDYTETPKESVHDTTSSIMSVIRKLLQEKIQLTENNSKDSLISNSETVILNKDELDRSVNSSLSPISIKTVITNDSILESELEAIDAVNNTNQNQSLWSYTGIQTPVIELDSLSYMSVASTSNSKYSEYYLADNELENTLIPHTDHLLDGGSLQDIVESKEENKNSVASGLEILSGFSMNAETPSDNINYTDSEIGSLALASARLTASEELFVSGRSSDTYESCFFDDDTYVPNWLFDAMSQQQSNEESDALDEQLSEVLDANGNVLEPGVGATSGAGDGKGIHSDNSQDSSGRGTSLSSTASSGPENEAILIDLSAVGAYAPLNALIITTSEETDGTDHNELPNERDAANRVEDIINSPQVTSSIDGDVSSMGTDAIDSD